MRQLKGNCLNHKAQWAQRLTFIEGRGNILYPLIQHYISSPTAYIQCVDFSPSDRQAIKANSLSQCRPPGSIGNDSPGTAVAKNGKSNVIRGQNCNLVTWSSPCVFVSLCSDWIPDLLVQEAYEQSANRNTKLVLLSYNHRKLQTSNHFSPCRTTKDCMEQFGKFVSQSLYPKRRSAGRGVMKIVLLWTYTPQRYKCECVYTCLWFITWAESGFP